MYALVNVNVDYDYVESLDCIGCYDTHEAAEAVMNQITEADCKLRLQHVEYVNQYVDNMEIPEVVPGDKTLFDKWCEFVASLNIRDISSTDFKDKLKQSMITGCYRIPRDDFNPPPKVGHRTMKIMQLRIQTKLPS